MHTPWGQSDSRYRLTDGVHEVLAFKAVSPEDYARAQPSMLTGPTYGGRPSRLPVAASIQAPGSIPSAQATARYARPCS